MTTIKNKDESFETDFPVFIQTTVEKEDTITSTNTDHTPTLDTKDEPDLLDLMEEEVAPDPSTTIKQQVEEEEVAEIDELEDDDKVEFFVRERSSSVDSELMERATRISPYSAKPEQVKRLKQLYTVKCKM